MVTTTGRDVLIVSTISEEQTGEVVPVADWSSGRAFVFIFGDKTRGPAGDALETLRFACDLAERGEGPDFERTTATSHGFQAYDLWAEALAAGEKLNQRAHAHNAQVVLAARQ